ncbi:MAG: phosphatidate cytidylyltransferase [Rubritepida sp.]|nr:phosphatidate cytidylyltransferase [Rubritepida sp.]
MSKLAILFSGVLGLLLVASLIGLLLARRGATPTIDNLNARIRAWWVMIAIFGISVAIGPGATMVLFTLISFYTLREFISLTPTRPADNLPLVAAFYLFLPGRYWLIWTEWYGLMSILIPAYGFVLLPCLTAARGDVDDFLLRVARTQWGLMLTVYCISHAPALLTLDIADYRHEAYLLLFFLLTVSQFSDVAQYVVGKLFGRRRMAPVVSPSKTWEGLLGGGATAMALGAGLWWITPFSPLVAAAMALLIVVMGFFGGIVLSAVKRSMGGKDWGSIVQGHGGVLDRMDSVAFSAPIFFHITRFFYTA